ncbi:winged helix-turn-helix domain-containing protein [Granulicella sp. S156]|uniref:winged helix-turn-helix domain-containing protein n=1 Tax=Granulicella sp. S156 TaxID=1747224 RepID=UPI00131C030C|nr:winged helix-turn-helix domain-containing protein [Granulicella sp. S156]
MSLTAKRVYQFGEFELNVESRVFERRGKRIPLGSKAFEVLVCLLVHAGEVVSKEMLLNTVWPESFVEESNLAQHIFALRKALGDRAGYIVTVSGRGYQFTEAVQEIVPESAQSLPEKSHEAIVQRLIERTHLLIEESAASPVLDAGARQKRLSSRRRFWITMAAALAIGAVVIAWIVVRRRVHSLSKPASVVVADFLNATGDAAFDRTLKRALEIDMAQSPYMDVLSGRETVRTLRMMGRQGDVTLTADIAREVCERTNRQVLLVGSISSVGSEYLLTLEATDCSTGERLTGAKAVAKTKAKILSALDSVAERVRTGLGESEKSVESFRVPIVQATTPSLEALKFYSLGMNLVAQSKDETESLPFFQRAVELDPQFAMAYGEIANDYYNLSEYNRAAPFFQKAFEYSEHVDAREKLTIQAHYYESGLGDILRGNKTYQVWAATYPQDWVPWLDLANNETQLGQYPASIEAGEQALKLGPGRGINYTVLARAYMRASRFEDAKRIGRLATGRSINASALNWTLFQIAFIEHDQKALLEITAWLAKHPDDWHLLDDQAVAAASIGQYKNAVKLFEQAYAIAERESLFEAADGILLDRAQAEASLGLISMARATMGRMTQFAPDSRDLMLISAQLGDATTAQRFLAANGGKSGSATLMTYIYLPQARAVLAMQHGKPLEAVAALETAKPYELIDYSVPIQRAETYVQARQPDMAIAEYKKVLANPGVDGTNPQYVLTHLGLARAYVMEGHVPEARSEYEAFFAAWKDADPDVPVLQQAHQEYARLR